MKIMSCTINGKIAPPAVKLADAVSIGDKMFRVFRRWLPSGFHAKMYSPIKTIPESAWNQAVSASLTRYSHRRWTATTISCYVALRRRSLRSGGVNEIQTCFSSRRVCPGFLPVR